MSEQRRVFLAVSACFLIFVGWQALMAKYFPAPPAPKVAVKAVEKAVVPTDEKKEPLKQDVVAAGLEAVPAQQPVGPETTHVLKTGLFKAVLSSKDGSLRHFSLDAYRETTHEKKHKEPVDLVTSQFEGVLKQAHVQWQVGQSALSPVMRVVSQDKTSVVFEGATESGVAVRLHVKPREDVYALDYVLTAVNTGVQEQVLVPQVLLSLTPQKHASGGLFASPADQIGGVCANAEGVERNVHADVEDKPFELPDARWVALDRQYFVASVLPLEGFGRASCVLSGGESGRMNMALASQKVVLKPQAQWRASFVLYMGPKKDPSLKAVSPLLLDVVDYTILHIPLGFLARPMVFLLNIFHTWTASWGLAIVLLTFLVKAVLFPVTFKSVVSMRKMQLLKPELDRIKAQFSKDPQRQQAEQLKLFREKGVNPLGGCLPMLLQMPVWFALYRMLWSSVDLYQQPFLWLADLTAKEPLPFMALAVGLLTFVQQKLTPTSMDSQQAKLMLWMMPVMLTVFMVALPSGLVLYTLVNTILTIIQQMAINKHETVV
jgi:YidC/Oxa1 family membrane protein insertase